MSFDNIALSAGMRNSLLSLQRNNISTGIYQQRLATGRKVNSPLDNPTNYFAASAARNRADDLMERKDAIGQAISTLNSANAGLTAIMQLLGSAKAIAETSTASTSAIARDSFAATFNTILDNIDTVARDSVYGGTNLLAQDSLVVQFSEQAGSSSLQVSGIDCTSGALGIGKITIPPIEAYGGGATSVTWDDIHSQVSVNVNTGGNGISDLVPGSLSIVDGNNTAIQPDAQYVDSDSGTITFYFTTPSAGNSYSASWDVAKNENKFTVVGLATPLQGVVVNGTHVASSTYSLSSSGTGLDITFKSGNEPQPGESVQYISGYDTTGQVQSVRVNNIAVSGSFYTVIGSAITFTNGHQPPPGQSQTVQYQQPLDPTWYPANPVLQSTAPGSGTFPRHMTSGGIGQTERLMIWTDSRVKKSLSQLDAALETVRSGTEKLHSLGSILATRNSFIDSMIQTLNTGADNLTLADMNEESANVLMLETRQSLGTTSLSLASEAARGILKLFP